MNIEFVSYTGKWPNLCSGVLTLNIDGKEVKFGHDFEKFESWKTDGNHESFWRSGGSCGFSYDYSEFRIETAPWEVDKSELPEFLKPYSQELIDTFNANVPFGCCGGCL